MSDSIDILRFTTCGSVDDGKSTLIGRLLHDCKSIFEDQWEAVQKTSAQKGHAHVDLALLTDGLRAEREQGITIDVAYRYFATPRRKFIIADTPGHIQYTRNMVTGASTANLAIILIDARKGILEQTCRHAFIASLLQIKHLVVCINKMDLVDWSRDVFERISREFREFASRLDIPDIIFIPVSALLGDNVVDKSPNTPWYTGLSLLNTLETVYVGSDANHVDARFPVQHVIRPQTPEWHDFRGFAGRVASGVYRTGDTVVHLPSGNRSRITKIHEPGGREVQEAFHPQSVVLTLADEIDISRGDMLVKPGNLPAIGNQLDLMVCWFSAAKPLFPRGRYILRHGTREVKCSVTEIAYKVDINTLQKDADTTIAANDIGRIRIRAQQPLFYDAYKANRQNGCVILIDEFTHQTVAAGMLLETHVPDPAETLALIDGAGV